MLNEENAQNNDFFSTRLSGAEYQTAYIDKPEEISSENLGSYASKMREQAIELADDRKYLKAAKRAFNYFLSIGNIAAMEAITPVFQSDQARVNQEVAVMEAIGSALYAGVGAVPTRILQVGDARNMLNHAAGIIEDRLSAVNIATGLRTIAAALPGNPSDLVQQNGRQSIRLTELIRETENLINGGLQAQVTSILDRFLRPYHQDINPTP